MDGGKKRLLIHATNNMALHNPAFISPYLRRGSYTPRKKTARPQGRAAFFGAGEGNRVVVHSPAFREFRPLSRRAGHPSFSSVPAPGFSSAIFRKKRDPALSAGLLFLERERGIEPPSSAWEADVLPLNHFRMSTILS